jgi:hypothetical protein
MEIRRSSRGKGGYGNDDLKVILFYLKKEKKSTSAFKKKKTCGFNFLVLKHFVSTTE